LEQLAELDRNNRSEGADVRMDAYRIVKDKPDLRRWLEESDRLSRELPGAARLRRRRRLGILRWTEGPSLGLPYFEPLVHPTAFAPEKRVLPLLDELDYVIIGGRIENGRWRPSMDELKFDEARAIAMMKAGTLYRLTWRKGAVPGCIRRRLDNDKRSRTSELRFDTVEFMGWGVVFKAYFKKK
jgi:hypothetical protein